jgi:hypothetical protein
VAALRRLKLACCIISPWDSSGLSLEISNRWDISFAVASWLTSQCLLVGESLQDRHPRLATATRSPANAPRWLRPNVAQTIRVNVRFGSKADSRRNTISCLLCFRKRTLRLGLLNVRLVPIADSPHRRARVQLRF